MRRVRPVFMIAALTLVGTLTTAPPRATQAQRPRIAVSFVIAGSTTMLGLAQLLSKYYENAHPDIHITVNATNNADGFTEACADTAQIGASDNYIQNAQLAEPGCSDMINIPVALTVEPVVYNLPGAYFTPRAADNFTPLHPLKLTPRVVAGIYLCQVSRWDDPAITVLNPGVTLPHQPIRIFQNGEAGGDNAVFDQWLSASDARWRPPTDAGQHPQWAPTCRGSVASVGTGQIVQSIANTPYSIGHVGFDYAVAYRLSAAALRNAAGQFLTPSLDGAYVALRRAIAHGFPSDFRRSFVSIASPNAYNPSSLEYFLVHRDLRLTPQTDAATRQAIKDFLHWTVSANGGQKFIAMIELGRSSGQTHFLLAPTASVRFPIRCRRPSGVSWTASSSNSSS